MILKFQLNLKLSGDMNTSTSAEAIVNSPEEAKEYGREFIRLAMALSQGMSETVEDEE